MWVNIREGIWHGEELRKIHKVANKAQFMTAAEFA
jgi:hypothetical protein